MPTPEERKIPTLGQAMFGNGGPLPSVQPQTQNYAEMAAGSTPTLRGAGQAVGKIGRFVADNAQSELPGAARAIYETPIPTLNPAIANAVSKFVAGAQSAFTGDNYQPQEYRSLSLKDMVQRAGFGGQGQPMNVAANTPPAVEPNPAAQPAAQARTNAAPPAKTAPAGKPGAPAGKPKKPGPIAAMAQPAAEPALTPTTERPFDGLAAYQKRLGSEQQTARQNAELEYRNNEKMIALQEYQKKFGVDFTPKYDGDKPENYRNYAEVDAARKRFAALDAAAPRYLTPEQANQTFVDYEKSPEAAAANKSVADMRAAGKVYDPMAGAGPIQQLRGPMTVDTPDGIQVLEGTQRNEMTMPFEGQYQTQEQIDATTGARKKVGDQMTVGEANATNKGAISLLAEDLQGKSAANVAKIAGQNARAVAGIRESGENVRLDKALAAKTAGLTEADILDGYSAYLAAKKGDLSGDPLMGYQEYKESVSGSRAADKAATPKTKADYDALPSGTIYIDPATGRRAVKP